MPKQSSEKEKEDVYAYIGKRIIAQEDIRDARGKLSLGVWRGMGGTLCT